MYYQSPLKFLNSRKLQNRSLKEILSEVEYYRTVKYSRHRKGIEYIMSIL